MIVDGKSMQEILPNLKTEDYPYAYYLSAGNNEELQVYLRENMVGEIFETLADEFLSFDLTDWDFFEKKGLLPKDILNIQNTLNKSYWRELPQIFHDGHRDLVKFTQQYSDVCKFLEEAQMRSVRIENVLIS